MPYACKIACLSFEESAAKRLAAVAIRLETDSSLYFSDLAHFLEGAAMVTNPDAVFFPLAAWRAGVGAAIRMQDHASVVIFGAAADDSRALAAAINDCRAEFVLPNDFDDAAAKEAFARVAQSVAQRRAARAALIADSFIDREGYATFQLDRDFRVEFKNRHADKLLGRRDPFLISTDGRLVCQNPADTRRMYDALTAPGASSNEHTNFIRIERAKSGPPVILRQMRAERHAEFAISFIISDPELRPLYDYRRFVASMNLTNAEARLVDNLVRGSSLCESAHCMNISINTARGYLKSIFTKTGLSRQAEVVRLAFILGG